MRFKPYQMKKMDDTSTEKSEYLCCRKCEHVLEHDTTIDGSIIYYCGNADCDRLKIYTNEFAFVKYSDKEVAAMRSSHVNYN